MVIITVTKYHNFKRKHCHHEKAFEVIQYHIIRYSNKKEKIYRI